MGEFLPKAQARVRSSATPGVLGPLRLPGFRAWSARTSSTSSELARRDRPGDPRLRPDRAARSPPRRCFWRCSSSRRSSRPPLVSRLESVAGRAAACRCSTPLEAAAFTASALLADRVRAGRRDRPRGDRRSPRRLGGARADPRLGGSDPDVAGDAARGKRCAQLRLHRLRRARAALRRAGRRRRRRRRRRCWADAVSFGIVALVIATARGHARGSSSRRRAWVERLRDGYRYVRDRPVAAPACSTARAPRSSSSRRDPDRGRVREGDARRRRRGLRRSARELGRGDGRRRRGVRGPAAALAARAARRQHAGRSGSPISARGAAPDAARRLRRRRPSAASATASSGWRWSAPSRS